MIRRRFTIQVERFVPGEEDAHGDLTDGWGPPVDRKVYGWATAGADQEIRPTGTGVDRDVDLYAPDADYSPRDRVTLRGTVFRVVGWPEDYDTGPFGYEPGSRVNLKRVEG